MKIAKFSKNFRKKCVVYILRELVGNEPKLHQTIRLYLNDLLLPLDTFLHKKTLFASERGSISS